MPSSCAAARRAARAQQRQPHERLARNAYATEYGALSRARHGLRIAAGKSACSTCASVLACAGRPHLSGRCAPQAAHGSRLQRVSMSCSAADGLHQLRAVAQPLCCLLLRINHEQIVCCMACSMQHALAQLCPSPEGGSARWPNSDHSLLAVLHRGSCGLMCCRRPWQLLQLPQLRCCLLPCCSRAPPAWPVHVHHGPAE